MHEWPLLIFTISMQTAIGGVLLLTIFYNKINSSGKDLLKVMKLPLIVITALSFIGLGASFAHLGSPGNAFNTILGFGHSWMSREIVFTGLFIGLVCLTTGLAFLQKKVNPFLLIVTGMVGLIDVYCMAAIYSNTLVNGWGHTNTFLSFYGTTFALGAMVTASLIVPVLGKSELTHQLLKLAFYFAIGGVAVELVGVAMFSTYSGDLLQIEGQASAIGLAAYEGTIAIRWVIEIVGIAVLAFLALSPNKKVAYSLTYLALIAILIGEVMSRYVFYALGA